MSIKLHILAFLKSMANVKVPLNRDRRIFFPNFFFQAIYSIKCAIFFIIFATNFYKIKLLN